MAHVTSSAVKHMLKAKLVRADVAIYPSGRKACSMTREEVDRMSELAYGAVSLQVAAAKLALPERRIRQLIEQGEIAPLVSRRVNCSASAWFIPANAFERLTVESAETQDATSITVRDFMRHGRLMPVEVVGLVRAVVRGCLLRVADDQCDMPIGRVILDRRAAWVWLLKLRAATQGHMSIDQAARELGLKQEVGYALAKAGLLGSCPDSSGARRVRQQDINQFRKEYVSLRDLAEEAGVSPRSMLRLIDVQPVAGPGVDGNRQYFFKRADLMQKILSSAPDPRG